MLVAILLISEVLLIALISLVTNNDTQRVFLSFGSTITLAPFMAGMMK